MPSDVLAPKANAVKDELLMNRKNYIISTAFAVLGLARISEAQGNDIVAAVESLFGSPPTTVVQIAGVTTTVGTPVSFDLDAGVFNQARPVRSVCIGPRNQDKSAMTLQSWSNDQPGSVALYVEIVGGTGFMPGSKGYIQVVNPNWVIDQVLSGHGPALPGVDVTPGPAITGSGMAGSGYGMRVDRVAGRLEWCGRGACMSCGCYENEVNFVVILRPKVSDQARFTLNTNGPLYPGNDTLQLNGTIATGTRGGNYLLAVTVHGGPGGGSLPDATFFKIVPTTQDSVTNFPIGNVNTAGFGVGGYASVTWTLMHRHDLNVHQAGTESIPRVQSQPAPCP